MTSESKEVETFFGRCRCCLSYSYLKNMWKEYYFQGKLEIYAQMLEQCYGFSLDEPDSREQDQICEGCIKRLRDAYLFRELIIESSNTMIENIVKGDDIGNDDKTDTENFEVQIVYEDEDSNSENMVIPKVEIIDDQSQEYFVEDTQDGEKFQYIDQLDDSIEYNDKLDVKSELFNMIGEKTDVKYERFNTDVEGAYEDVEYLDDDVDLKQKGKSLKQTNDKDYEVKPKWPKKLPRLDRNRRYKQYTEEDLRKCLEEIRSGMPIADASRFYSIPRKTIDKKLKTYSMGRDEKKDETYKFHKEIKSILSFTNATPYKSIIVKYSCIYCLKAIFTDPEDLRNHTRTVHADERTKSVDIFMRPHWENEILKLDIDNLLCVVCCTLIQDWNKMLNHLTVTHNVILDQAYSKVIPYILSNEPSCVLCKEVFTNYLQLDGHMNSHYDNYVCSECGDHFLTHPRLKAHQKTHEVGNYPCEVCHKVFGQEKYKRKHVKAVHNHVKRYKCVYCIERFPSEISRQKHVEDKHMDKIKPINCEVCGKVFYWRQYFNSHMKKRHGEKNHVCPVCGKRFSRKYQMQEHTLSHVGEKTVECPVCHKKYMTKTSLRVHILNQHKNKGTNVEDIVILKV